MALETTFLNNDQPSNLAQQILAMNENCLAFIPFEEKLVQEILAELAKFDFSVVDFTVYTIKIAAPAGDFFHFYKVSKKLLEVSVNQALGLRVTFNELKVYENLIQENWNHILAVAQQIIRGEHLFYHNAVTMDWEAYQRIRNRGRN